MKNKVWRIAENIIRAGITLFAGFLICLLLQYYLDNGFLIPSVLVLCVFLISVYTDGYVYGIVGAISSVLHCQFCIYISIFQDKSFDAGECCVGVYHACNHAGDMLPYKQDKVSGADKVRE